ncbi:MAG: insulinase family protein [Gemmatimonadetes bacterium]|nr:insulinase family protein [Gemmatimonadota bacterium]
MTHIVPGIRPSVLQLLAILGLVLFGSVVPRSGWSQTSDSWVPPPGETNANPFSGFETHFLSNGLKVWFKRLPGAPDVSISLGVPYGWDADPRGKEELAHLTEHVLFSDHDGQTEQEIKEAIDGICSRRNGFTTPDHTWYYLTVSKEHGGFAIEWLSRVMSPHSLDADVVERSRQPVAQEINVQRRGFLEQAWALLNPSWLLPPDFWWREFRMETRDRRQYDRWASLQNITAQDVSDFYDRYYVPGAMTLTVIGDLDRSEVLEMSERTFGSLPERPVPQRDVDIEDPARWRTTTYWGFGPNVRYSARYKFFNNGAEDDLMMLFVRDLLRRRLNQRLGHGDQKAGYGLPVTTTQRGPGGFLQIQGSIDENEFDFAETIIQEEIGALRTGTVPPDEFEADRTALVEGLRGENSTAEALNFWVYSDFYDPFKHSDFPDLLSFFEGVTQQEVASFVAVSLALERKVATVVRVQPVSRGILATAALLIVFLTVRLGAWRLTRPVRMGEIRYVARFRVPVLLKIGAAVLFGGAGLILARLIAAVGQSVGLFFLASVHDYTIQMTAFALVLATAVVLFILCLSRIPAKVLVFPDHLLIKSLAYRSRRFEPADLAEVSTARFPEVWLKKGLLWCIPLTFGLRGPGIYLRPWSGRAYFFRTRNTRDLIDLLSRWRMGVESSMEGLDDASTGLEGRELRGLPRDASTKLEEGDLKDLLREVYAEYGTWRKKPGGKRRPGSGG